MSNFFSGRSLLLIFVCLSFAGCEQFIEIIKPTQPVPSCILTKEGEHEYVYDSQGRITALTNYGDEGGANGGPRPASFQYNDKGQITHASWPVSRDGVTRAIHYDEQGRISYIQVYNTYYYTVDEAFSYKTDTIFIKTTQIAGYMESAEQYEIWEDVLCFKNGNLIRHIQRSVQNYTNSVDNSYSYSSTVNKISKPTYELGLILGHYGPLMSKNLPASSIDQNGGQKSYQWLFNEQGYPVNNGLSSQIHYEYGCK